MRDIVADCSSKAGDESTQNSSRSVMQPPGDNYAGASSRASENVALLPGEAEVEGAVEQDIPQQSLEVMHSMGLEIGSMVEIPLIDGQRERYGVIRWIGHLTAVKGKLVAGLELVCIALLAGVHLEEHYKKIISLRIFMTWTSLYKITCQFFLLVYHPRSDRLQIRRNRKLVLRINCPISEHTFCGPDKWGAHI